MNFARAVRRGSAVVAALAMTTACLPADDAGSGDGGSSESTPKGGQQLSEEQTREVLPGEGELPPELQVDQESPDPPDPGRTAYPENCLDVELNGKEGEDLDEHIKAKTTQGYVGDFGGLVSVSVVTHDIPVPGELFDAAGAAHSSCSEYRKIDKSGTTKWKVEPATLPPMGDRTYAIGLEMLTGNKDFNGGKVQLAGVIIGHNLVYIVHTVGPSSQLSTEVIEELARTTVDHMEQL